MKHPNIVLFLAEDLDFEGLNCYNAEAVSYTHLDVYKRQDYYHPINDFPSVHLFLCDQIRKQRTAQNRDNRPD